MSYIRDFTTVWKCVPFCSDPTEFRSPLPWVTLYKFPNQQNSGNSQIMMGQTYPATRKLILAITGNQFIILVRLFKSSCSPFYCIWIQKKWSPMTKLHNWNMLTAHFFFKSYQWPKSFCWKQKNQGSHGPEWWNVSVVMRVLFLGLPLWWLLYPSYMLMG